MAASGPRFSQLLLEGLDHYRKGRMLEAVRVWEEAYLLEPTNLRAREFLRSALERIHAHVAPPQGDGAAPPAPQHPWLPAVSAPPVSAPAPAGAMAQTVLSAPPAKQPLPPPPPLDDLPGSSPWDDGPSLAIPHEERSASAGDETSGAWKIHKEPSPTETGGDHEVDIWMRGARELMALNDFSGALELLEKILARKPQDKAALEMHASCEHNLTLMFESRIGTMDARPRIAIKPDEIIWLNLDPRAGFVLAQIDGEVTFEDLYAICGLKRLDTARILSQLLEEGVVNVDGQDRAVAKRALHR